MQKVSLFVSIVYCHLAKPVTFCLVSEPRIEERGGRGKDCLHACVFSAGEGGAIQLFEGL